MPDKKPRNLEYVQDNRGNLVLMHGEKMMLHLLADDTFGISYVLDSDRGKDAMPFVLKHGPAKKVREHYECHRDKFITGAKELQHAGFDDIAETSRQMASDLEMLEVPVRNLTSEMVEEINACLAITGRVGQLKRRLEGLSNARSLHS